MRDQLATKQAQKILRLIESSQIRAHASEVFRHNDTVQQWNPVDKKWHGASRCIFDSGRNVYIERGNSVLKVPRQWIRVRGVLHSSSAPEKLTPETTNVKPVEKKTPGLLNRIVPTQGTQGEERLHEPSSSSTDVNPPTPLMPLIEANEKDRKRGDFIPWENTIYGQQNENCGIQLYIRVR